MEEFDFLTEQTDDIIVSACPVLMDKSSNNYIWGYYLCIENNSDDRIQLVGKNWNITDAAGRCYCDNSTGFKGEIPELEPGECFEFTDTAPLSSSLAVFYGSCKVKHLGRGFTKDIKIPTFHLSTNKQTSSCLMN